MDHRKIDRIVELCRTKAWDEIRPAIELFAVEVHNDAVEKAADLAYKDRWSTTEAIRNLKQPYAPRVKE